MIKHITFLDQVEPPEKKLQSYFAYSMFEYITNEPTNVNPLSVSQIGLFKDDLLTSLVQLLELNKQSWNTFAEPYKEFER